MQLTLDDLRKASDPLALLLGADDEALDDLLAQLLQIDLVRDDISGDLKPERTHWGVWNPSCYLDQAYTALFAIECDLDPLSITWKASSIDGQRYWDWQQEVEDGGRFTVARVTLPQAGSHARAVVVLAILGLLGKDGGA